MGTVEEAGWERLRRQGGMIEEAGWEWLRRRGGND